MIDMICMTRRNILFPMSLLLLILLAVSACSRNYSWDYHMLVYGSACERKQYKEAEKQLSLAVDAAEKLEGEDVQTHYGRVQGTLHNLADLYKELHLYAEAEPIYFRCLAIMEKYLKSDYLNMSEELNSLGEIYQEQGKYDKAELFYKRSLTMAEKVVAPSASDLPLQSMDVELFPVPSSDGLPPQCLHNLVLLYASQNKYPQAEMLYERWAKILEQQFGPSSSGAEICLGNLSELYRDEGKNVLADKCTARADKIRRLNETVESEKSKQAKQSKK